MAANTIEDPKELIRVNKDARGTMDISFDPETAFRVIQDLKGKAKTHLGSNEDFVTTYTKAVEEIQAAINDPAQKTNALARIRELNNARLLRNSDQLETMLRGLKSPTLDALIKARLSGSLKTEIAAKSIPVPDSTSTPGDSIQGSASTQAPAPNAPTPSNNSGTVNISTSGWVVTGWRPRPGTPVPDLSISWARNNIRNRWQVLADAISAQGK